VVMLFPQRHAAASISVQRLSRSSNNAETCDRSEIQSTASGKRTISLATPGILKGPWTPFAETAFKTYPTPELGVLTFCSETRPYEWHNGFVMRCGHRTHTISLVRETSPRVNTRRSTAKYRAAIDRLGNKLTGGAENIQIQGSADQGHRDIRSVA
jgi:hypothetical protein